MILLSREDIVEINRLVLRRTGTHRSDQAIVLNTTGLDYLVESISATVFGRAMFPSVHEKAARYAVGIIQDHIFMDGNKRTGLLAALMFLELNGWSTTKDLSEDEIVEFGLAMAQSKVGMEEATEWFSRHTEQ